MNFCLSVIFLLAITQKALQNCVSIGIVQRYYSRFSRLPPRKYIQCEKVVISKDFHEQIEPLEFNTQIEWLEINNTESPEIATRAFSTLQKLPVLRIKGASVQVIQPGAFDGLTALKQLSLSGNKISIIENYFFINLTNLNELDLSYNNIAVIKDGSFTNLTNLQRLLLQNNFLNELSTFVFQNLKRVEFLDLSFNKIVNINDKLLKNLTNLNTLILQHNNLQVIDSNMLSNNPQIKNLYINNNHLSSLNNFTLVSSLENFNVSHNLIQILEFSKYTKQSMLDLSENGILSISKISFKNVAVVTLYLDHNYLGSNPIGKETFSNLTSLEKISLSGNLIKQLDPNLFKNNSRLRVLNLSKNYLRSNGPLYLPVSLQSLNLSFNYFDSRLNLTGLSQLKTLDLSFNNLTQLSFNILSGLEWLFQLNLRMNQIAKINLGCFRDLKRVRELDLSFNKISVLEMGIFVGLNDLYRLDISHNKLTVINEGVFHNLRYLQILNLNYNNVTYSSVEDTISHLPSLKYIGLAGNDWPCSFLTQIIKEYRKVSLQNAGDFLVTNVDGIACKYEVKDPENLIKLETQTYISVNSKLNTISILLIFILLLLLIKLSLKYLSGYFRIDRLRRRKTEQELQLVNECE